jgi:hypothetical protein
VKGRTLISPHLGPGQSATELNCDLTTVKRRTTHANACTKGIGREAFIKRTKHAKKLWQAEIERELAQEYTTTSWTLLQRAIEARRRFITIEWAKGSKTMLLHKPTPG